MRQEKIVLAGGCFWGMEDLFRKLPGVTATRVGYAGGSPSTATYLQVKEGHTGHAEALEISFDPSEISLERILRFFFTIHDPTTQDRQGNDRGSQYRSAIFYAAEEQRLLAERIKDLASEKKIWPAEIVTEITPLTGFYEAEDYHQDYLEKNPGGYTCHYIRKIDF